MSAAEDAYKAAQKRIAEAKREGATDLSLDATDCRALKVLPPEIAALTDLESLGLGNTGIADLTPLSGLTALQALHLDNTQVAELAPLSGLTALQELYLSNTQVTELAPLSGLTALQRLTLDNTQVAELAPLSGLTALQTLYLSGTQVAELAPLSGLTALQTLHLGNTQVAELAPLSGLTALQTLYLDNTQVAELAPLSAMHSVDLLWLNNTKVSDMRPLVDHPGLLRGAERGWIPLAFKNTPATRLDPDGLGRLAEIKDDKQRTIETLAYLKTLDRWPPQVPASPDPGDVLAVAVTEDGVDVPATAPDAEEKKDRVKQAAHKQLKEGAQTFAQIAENRHYNVARRGWKLLELLDAPFSDLDLLQVHFELEKLRGVYDRRAERTGEDALTADEIDALSDLLTIGPGLVRDHADVEKIEDRKNRGTEAMSEETVAALNAMMQAIVDDPDLMRERIRAFADFGKDAEPETPAAEVRRLLSRETLVGVGRYVGPQATAALVGAAATATATGSAEMLAANASWLVAMADPLTVVASTQGASFEAWIRSVLERARLYLKSVGRG